MGLRKKKGRRREEGRRWKERKQKIENFKIEEKENRKWNGTENNRTTSESHNSQRNNI